MPDPDSELAARIAIIKQEFLGRLHSEGLPKLRDLGERFRADPTDAVARSELRRVTHDLIGSGAVFGYDEISAVGRKLEAALRALLAQDGPENAQSHADILALVERLTTICAATERDLNPSAEQRPT